MYIRRSSSNYRKQTFILTVITTCTTRQIDLQKKKKKKIREQFRKKKKRKKEKESSLLIPRYVDERSNEIFIDKTIESVFRQLNPIISSENILGHCTRFSNAEYKAACTAYVQ